MRLKIRRLDSTLPLPAYGTAEAAGFDLAAAHDETIAPGAIVLVRTGLVVEVPAGTPLCCPECEVPAGHPEDADSDDSAPVTAPRDVAQVSAGKCTSTCG